MRTAVVGHLEWVTFARVPAVPASGEIVHASDVFEVPAGGGAAAAVQLAKLAGNCLFITALGDDELGHRAVEGLAQIGVTVAVAWRTEPTRRAFTHVDEAGERTITVLGDRLSPLGDDELPWDDLAGIDALYFTAGDGQALKSARAARVLVATARAGEPLARAGVQLDALVGSVADPSEVYRRGDITPEPKLVVRTEGAAGGTFETADGVTDFDAPPLAGAVVDRYGAGDAFAAGLAFALARGDQTTEAIAFAARCGAAVVTGRGPYDGQLTQ